MEKQATIRDVARLAGVSLATASRALNDSDYPVSAPLRQRVREAAAQLEYVPNGAARALRREQLQDVGLVLPNISNPFYLQTMVGIDDVLARNHHSIILCNTMRNVEQERACLRQLYERQTRGVILSSVDENAETVRSFQRKGMKFVFLDQKLTGVESVGLQYDNCGGVRMAMEHLLSLGHRDIAFLTLPLTRWSRQEMLRGYHEALLAAGVACREELVFAVEKTDVSPWQGEDVELTAGRRLGESFIRRGCPATAILCGNDMVAMGVILTLKARGIRVPEDVSVCGFDDIPFAAVFSPALTTVHYPAAETGRLAALMLLDLLSDSASDMTVSMNLTPRLVLRDTVAPPKGRG